MLIKAVVTTRDWLISRRKKANVTQKFICDTIGISQATYSNIELGKRKPSVKLAKKIAALLGFDWTLFFKD